MLETWWYHHHLFKCLFVYVEGYAGTSLDICASGGQRWTSGIFLNSLCPERVSLILGSSGECQHSAE